jgi:hypothetical protein
MAAGLLKSGVQHETSVAHRLINEMHAIGVKPHFQDELSTHPWNMTDDAARKWVEDLRNVGCSKNPSIVAVAKHAHIYILSSNVALFPSRCLSSLGFPPFHSHHYIIIFTRQGLFLFISQRLIGCQNSRSLPAHSLLQKIPRVHSEMHFKEPRRVSVLILPSCSHK